MQIPIVSWKRVPFLKRNRTNRSNRNFLFSKYTYTFIKNGVYSLSVLTTRLLRHECGAWSGMLPWSSCICRKKEKKGKEKERKGAKQVLDEGRNPASRRRLIKGTVELAFRVGAAAKFQIDRVQFGRALSNVVSCIMHGTWRAGWPPEYKSVRAVSFPPSLPALRFTRFVVPGC